MTSTFIWSPCFQGYKVMSVCNVKIRLQGRIGSALAHDTLRECRRLLTELLPEPEVIGLLSLMLLQESRRAARTSPTGDLILLEKQDRSLWNREQIAEGVALLEKALKSRRFGSYTLQAAIAAVHAEAESTAATDWRQVVALYNQLVR